MSEVTAATAARAALAAMAEGPAVAVALVVTPDAAVRRMLIRHDGATTGSLGAAALDARAVELAQVAFAEAALEPVVETVGDVTLYVEAHQPREQLIIVGAGHIAVPLAQLGVLLDFRVTVLDDREEFATTERFDERVTVRRADFATDPFAGVQLDASSYLALVTRGHRWDFDCLRRVLGLHARPRYIGMIGSRRRVRAAFHALLEAGVARSTLAQIHAPIGLDLNAETPQEIAVSIAAELVAVRRGADAASLAAREHVLDRFLREEP